MYGDVAVASPVIYENFQQIKDGAEVVIFDAYGVFWNGKELYDGSEQLMHDLISEGKLVYVLSNNTQMSKEAMASYEKRGLRRNEHYHEFVTSGDFTNNVLREARLTFKSVKDPKNVYIFGTPNRKIFEGTKYNIVDRVEDASFVYVSTPQLTEEQYDSYPHKEQLRESGSSFFGAGGRRWDSLVIDPFIPELENFRKMNLPILVANPDLVAGERTRDGMENNLVIRQGSITVAYRKMGGEVVEFGKPDGSIYDTIFRDIEKRGRTINKNRIFMVGDTIRTDIKGAKNVGIKSVLCTETGVTASEVKKRLGRRLEEFEKDKNLFAGQTRKIEEIKKAILMDLQKEEGCTADYLIEGISKNYGKKTLGN
jgi:HAD superfamily hydrolase (TIGR01450 family)